MPWCRALLVTWDGLCWWHCHPLDWEGGVGHSHHSAVMKLRCHLTASLCGNPEAVSEHPEPVLSWNGWVWLQQSPCRTLVPHALFCPAQDLEGKIIVDELKQEVISTSSKAEPPQCTSLAWSADGQVEISPSPFPFHCSSCSLKTPTFLQHLRFGSCLLRFLRSYRGLISIFS